MSTIQDYIQPSEEIQADDGGISTEGLLDEVSLYNLYDEEDSPEQDAKRILDITYPTEKLTDIIQNSIRKVDDSDSLSEGAHVIGGGYGSGKSHIELVVYHLLDSPDVGQPWLDNQGIDVELPDDTRTAALQMLNLSGNYNRLWEAVGEYLGVEEWTEADDVPSVHQIRDSLEGQKTAVFIDEFERWFNMAVRDEYQSDNLAFLQNLLEAAGREDTSLLLFVSLLYENPDVEAILQRTNPFTHDLSSRRDEKIQFLIHRLVGEVTDPEGIESLAQEYVDVYRQNDQIQLEDYQEKERQVVEQYPFHPDLLRLLMEKFSEQSGHQDARGLLHFLTEVLSDNYTEVDLILTSNVDVFGYIDRFRFIDTELVSKYSNDYHRLQGADEEFEKDVEELLNIVLLHSLARAGKEGANKRAILMGMMRKGVNAHQIIQTFTEDVYGHAWHIHRLNGEYAFDIEENPAARIEKKSEDIHKHDAIHRVESLVKEDLFRGRNNVYILNPVNTEQDIPDNKTLKIVVSLAAKVNYDDEFESLTTGQGREFNNTLVLVTPEKRSSIDSNTGIIELARKVVAGEKLKGEEDALPEGFEEIHDQNYQNLLDRVQDKYGTVHTSTERGLFPQELSVEDDGDFYSATIEVVEPDASQLRSEIEEAVEDAGASGIEYEFLKMDFYRNTDYSTLTDEKELEDAIDYLCRGGDIQAGNYFEEKVRSLGNDTTLVHEKYVETEEEEEEEQEQIKIKHTPKETSTSASTGEEETEEEAVSAFECPQCGNELEGTKCECGFEFDATDLKEGKVTVDEGSTEDLIDTFEEIQEEIEDEEEIGDGEEETEPYPMMGGPLEADNKPDLLDTLDRNIGLEWEVHEIEVTMEGTLTSNDLEDFGVNEYGLGDNASLDETLYFEPPEPLSKQELIKLVRNMRVPEKASFELQMQVNRND